MSAKIQKLICIIALIAALISTQTAALLETMYDPAHYFVGLINFSHTSGKWFWMANTYYNDYTGGMTDDGYLEGSSDVYGVFMSKIQPDTFYSFTIPVSYTGAQPELENGDILPSVNQWFNVIPAASLPELEPSNGSRYSFLTDPLELIPSDYYKMYYDASAKTLSVVFYLPSSYVDDRPELLEHCYLTTSLGTSLMIDNVPVGVIYGQTDVLTTGIYTQILNDIVTKLDAISNQGSGLTELQVQRAIQRALSEHAAEEYREASGYGQNALDQVGQEAESTVGELINSGLLGVGAQVSGIFDLSQRAILTVPTIKIPAIGDIVPEMTLYAGQQFDITEMLDHMIPEVIIKLVRVINTILLLTYICKEVYGIFVRFLNGGENVV